MRQGVAPTSVWSVTAQSSHTTLHQDFTGISPLLIPFPVASVAGSHHDRGDEVGRQGAGGAIAGGAPDAGGGDARVAGLSAGGRVLPRPSRVGRGCGAELDRRREPAAGRSRTPDGVGRTRLKLER